MLGAASNVPRPCRANPPEPRSPRGAGTPGWSLWSPREKVAAMRAPTWLLVAPILLSCAHSMAGDAPPKPAAVPAALAPPPEAKPDELKPEEVKTKETVTVGGKRIDYTAIAGTLVIKPKEDEEEPPAPGGDKGEKPPQPAAQMSFVAY